MFYEQSRLNRGLSLISTAVKSLKESHKKKLLQKSNWHRRRRNNKDEEQK